MGLNDIQRTEKPSRNVLVWPWGKLTIIHIKLDFASTQHIYAISWNTWRRWFQFLGILLFKFTLMESSDIGVGSFAWRLNVVKIWKQLRECKCLASQVVQFSALTAITESVEKTVLYRLSIDSNMAVRMYVRHGLHAVDNSEGLRRSLWVLVYPCCLEFLLWVVRAVCMGILL